MVSFIESGFATRAEYESSLKTGGGGNAAAAPAVIKKDASRVRQQSFIESKFTTRAEYEAGDDPEVVIYGMPISANVIPPVLFVMDHGIGKMEMMNIMTGENKTPEKLAIHPWGQMPMMKDGEFGMGESNAILRYLAAKYAPQCYGGNSLEAKAQIDWALDWISSGFSKPWAGLWYPTAGFGSPPEDQAAVNALALDHMDKFVSTFLKNTKFVGGDTPSIADYKIAVHFWYLDHPAIKKHRGGFECPPLIKDYYNRFLAACTSKDFLKDAKGFFDTKI